MTQRWYRQIAACARWVDRMSGIEDGITLTQEEQCDVGYPEHLSRVADLLEKSGVDDDMGDESCIVFVITYRAECEEAER